MTPGPDDIAQPETNAQDDVLTAHLRASMESMPDGFLLVDRDWRLLYLNRQIELALQKTRAEMLGRDLWEVFPESLGTVAETEYRRVMREAGSAAFELFYPPLSLRLEIRAFAIEGGGLAIYVRDVTQVHQRKERAQLLHAAVSRLDDMVMITEAESGDENAPLAVFVNQAFERMSGYSAEEVRVRPRNFMRGPQTDDEVLTRLYGEIRQGRVSRGEVMLYRKDGSSFWVDLQAAPFSDPGGKATHIVMVGRDISDRKRSEAALRESNERFRIVAQSTADVVWDWNLIDDTIWWGDGMGARFGYSYEGTTQIGDSWVRHIHPEDSKRVVKSITGVIDGGGTHWSDEYRFIRADGSTAQVVDRGVVMRDEGGAAFRMVGSMVDVTEQRELEAQLRQSQRLEAIGQLTGGVAHDFNNLLTVILSNAELLETRLAGNDQLHMLASMSRMAAERGAELVSRLLAFSRRQALDPKPTDVSTLVRGMEGLLRRAVGEQVELLIVAEQGLWGALIDTLQLEAAILNLCINARDAMPEGGQLRVELTNAPRDASGADCVLVCVADTGTGMDEATKRRAFEPFFTTKDVGKGSGLGLSMVYGFVTQSKGRVEIDTALGRGTRVKLYLPRAAQLQTAEADETPLDALSGNERVLVAEDDDLVRVQVSTELGTLGYRVVTVRNGAEALAALRADGPFDLLFTDVVMPGGMNGKQLAEAALEIVPGLRVLYTSGNPDIVADEGRIAAGTHLLRKPYKRRELALKLREALKAR